jgi:hypothetical protein
MRTLLRCFMTLNLMMLVSMSASYAQTIYNNKQLNDAFQRMYSNSVTDVDHGGYKACKARLSVDITNGGDKHTDWYGATVPAHWFISEVVCQFDQRYHNFYMTAPAKEVSFSVNGRVLVMKCTGSPCIQQWGVGGSRKTDTWSTTVASGDGSQWNPTEVAAGLNNYAATVRAVVR